MPKKVAIVSSSCPPVSAGGVASSHYHLYRALTQKGFQVRLYTFEDYKVALAEKDVTRVGMSPGLVNTLRRLIGWYFRIVDPSRITYHFADVAVSAWPCMMLNSAIRDFQPDVLILPDHGCPGLFIAKPKGCRTILISHHNPMRFLNNPIWGLHSERDARLTVACENRVLRKVDAVVCPSQYMQEMFNKTYAYSGPVTVIPNMVDAELIASIPSHDIRGKLVLPDDSIVIYVPSAGSVYKGARFVSEIVRRISSCTTMDIGFYLSGNIAPDLAYELRSAPTNAKVYAPGQVSYADNLAVVKACSFGISPTLIENFGMALLEASMCGVPMVSFDVGGNADVVSNGRSGVLVPFLDVEALINAACRLLDAEYCAKLRRETVLSVADRFSSNLTVEKFINLMK
ncbi:MAG: N-acetyl-alpha-D-glucosaminyl L-malate synthase [Nitrosomonadaceae bacterium]|nr:N-acetyl-alpha-D-glucosaminyl L-malate synthase [Nitrosomonadaceae bacterium]